MSAPYVLGFVGENANGILFWWTEKILQNFARFNLEYKIVDLQKPDAAQTMMQIISQHRPAFCFSFQGMGMAIKDETGQNLWSRNKVPFLTYLGDSPYHAPQLHGAEGEGLYLLYSCLDFFEVYKEGMHGRTFAGLIDYNYPFDPQVENPDWSTRPIKLLYAKTPSRLEKMHEEFDSFPRLIREAAYESAQQALKGPDQTIFQICRDVLERQNVYMGKHREVLLHLCSKVDFYVRAVHAERMVKALLPHDAIIVGDWTHLSQPSTRARIVAPVPAEQLNALYSQTQVVVNSLPSVRHGIHERVMAGLLSQSAVISDTTPFLSSLLAGCPAFAGVNIDSVDFSDQFDTACTVIFADPDIRDKINCSAVEARRLFSLDTFVNTLMEYIVLECHRRNVAGWWGVSA